MTIAAVAVAVALSADTLVWFFGIRILTSETDRWIAQAQSQDWVIATGARATDGWPFTARMTVANASISGGERYVPGGLAWSADRLVLSVSLFHPLTLVLSASGQQFLRLSHAPDLGFYAVREVANLPLMLGRHGQGELKVTSISGGIAGSRHPQDVQVASLSIRLAGQSTGPAAPGRTAPVSVRLDVNAGGIGLPDIGRWPLGATIEEAGATLALSSPALPTRQPGQTAAKISAASQATAWRDGDGGLAVRHARLRWGPLALDAQADVKLDAALQPVASGTADVAGTAPALDAASDDHLLPSGLALTAEAALAVMPHVRLPDGADAVRLPFLLRDGTVSVGEIPVAQVPKVTWQHASVL